LAKIKVYAYNHDYSALLTSPHASGSLLSLATTTINVSDQEPAATWYLPLFNRGVTRRSGHFRNKIGAHTPMSDVARIGADPDLRSAATASHPSP
jgi:hypothetical protein